MTLATQSVCTRLHSRLQTSLKLVSLPQLQLSHNFICVMRPDQSQVEEHYRKSAPPATPGLPHRLLHSPYPRWPPTGVHGMQVLQKGADPIGMMIDSLHQIMGSPAR